MEQLTYLDSHHTFMSGHQYLFLCKTAAGNSCTMGQPWNSRFDGKQKFHFCLSGSMPCYSLLFEAAHWCKNNQSLQQISFRISDKLPVLCYIVHRNIFYILSVQSGRKRSHRPAYRYDCADWSSDTWNFKSKKDCKFIKILFVSSYSLCYSNPVRQISFCRLERVWKLLFARCMTRSGITV